MMPDFARTMARLRDEQLFHIATAEPDTEYDPDAILAAQREIDRRGLPQDVTDDLVSQISQDRNEEQMRPEEQLSNLGMIGFLLFGPLLIVSIPLAIMLSAQGYSTKAKGAFGAIILSYVLYLFVFVTIAFVAWIFGL